MKLYDSHLHCSFSTDSDTPAEEQILKGIALGLSGMTFTDHLDPEFPLDNTQYIFDTNEYFNTLSPLKEKYKEKIDVLIGAELGMRPDQVNLLPSMAADKPYDFIIGSIHVVDGYDPYYREYWNDYGTEKGLKRFFELTAECVEIFDYYDTLGHIDYIYRYAPDGDKYPIECFADEIDRILKCIIAKGKALEINTAGLKYGIPYAHPQPYIMKRYYELGGRLLTLGSDGHKPEHIAYGFDQIAEYIKSFGFDGYVRFKNRKPYFIPLNEVNYDLAIFDMDGTILDTLEDLYNAANYALHKNGLPLRTKDEVRFFVGNGIRKLIERAVPAGTSKDIEDKVYETFMSYYPEHCADSTCEYAGITECIKSLKRKGIKTAVVSNKADPAVQILAEQYFSGLFDISIGEKPGINKKPAPDSVNAVLDKLNIAKENAIYIGDSDVDIDTAKNAGIECIGVSWGFRGEEFLREHGAKLIARTPSDIEMFI